jgi:hypothetical protein
VHVGGIEGTGPDTCTLLTHLTCKMVPCQGAANQPAGGVVGLVALKLSAGEGRPATEQRGQGKVTLWSLPLLRFGTASPGAWPRVPAPKSALLCAYQLVGVRPAPSSMAPARLAPGQLLPRLATWRRLVRRFSACCGPKRAPHEPRDCCPKFRRHKNRSRDSVSMATTATRSASGAVELASSCQLPAAVADSSHRHVVDMDPHRVLRTERLKDAGVGLQVAPYQATPICGAITHHHAAGLDIPDDSRSEEVRITTVRPFGFGGTAAHLILRPRPCRSAWPRSTTRSRSMRRSCRSGRPTTWGEHRPGLGARQQRRRKENAAGPACARSRARPAARPPATGRRQVRGLAHGRRRSDGGGNVAWASSAAPASQAHRAAFQRPARWCTAPRCLPRIDRAPCAALYSGTPTTWTLTLAYWRA